MRLPLIFMAPRTIAHTWSTSWPGARWKPPCLPLDRHTPLTTLSGFRASIRGEKSTARAQGIASMDLAETQTRRIDGAVEAGQFAGYPVFYFDLAPVLCRSESGFSRDPDRLQALCRHGLASLGGSDLTLFDSNGFYLIVGSCSGAQAEALANRVNVALLKLFFGTESLMPDQMLTMFRIAGPSEFKSPEQAALIDRAAKLIGAGRAFSLGARSS